MAQAVETHIDARIDQKFSIATSFLVKNSIVFELLIFLKYNCLCILIVRISRAFFNSILAAKRRGLLVGSWPFQHYICISSSTVEIVLSP